MHSVRRDPLRVVEFIALCGLLLSSEIVVHLYSDYHALSLRRRTVGELSELQTLASGKRSLLAGKVWRLLLTLETAKLLIACTGNA